MDGKRKKKKLKKKGARKQICFQICMPGACSGVGMEKRRSRGPPVRAACVCCRDGADGTAAPRKNRTGQDSPGTLGALRALQPCTATVHPGEAGVWCRGVSQEPGRRGMGGSRDVFKCSSLYICSLNAYGTGRQSIWALHNN